MVVVLSCSFFVIMKYFCRFTKKIVSLIDSIANAKLTFFFRLIFVVQWFDKHFNVIIKTYHY